MAGRYKSKITSVWWEGIEYRFHSATEAKRFVYLKTLEGQNEISELELQPKFSLVEKFRSSTGRAIRACDYIADFRYISNGRIVVEDTKGHKTDLYMLKRKLFLAKYSDSCIFRESYATKNGWRIVEY